MNERAKKVSESKTEQVHILMPQDINGSGRLFGGVLMQWIDVVAAVVARRHAGSDVTTASVENLVFHASAGMNDTILMIGMITYVGRTSMEVSVETFVEALDGVRKLVNHAYVVMVAVDGEGKPREVPRLDIQSEDELARYEVARKRHELRKVLRKKEDKK